MPFPQESPSSKTISSRYTEASQLSEITGHTGIFAMGSWDHDWVKVLRSFLRTTAVGTRQASVHVIVGAVFLIKL